MTSLIGRTKSEICPENSRKLLILLADKFANFVRQQLRTTCPLFVRTNLEATAFSTICKADKLSALCPPHLRTNNTPLYKGGCPDGRNPRKKTTAEEREMKTKTETRRKPD
jgi:hypothetical protein